VIHLSKLLIRGIWNTVAVDQIWIPVTTLKKVEYAKPMSDLIEDCPEFVVNPKGRKSERIGSFY
jgi:hypothetical protein